jgi:hypothetical protein
MLAAVLGDPGLVDAEPGLGEVSHDRDHPVTAPAPDQGLHPGQ